jgi:gliding motility-associated-like protein
LQINFSSFKYGKVHIVGVGIAVITASQAQDATHNAAANQQQTLTVGQKSLTVTLNTTPAITKIFDGTINATLAAGNYTLNGVVGSDAVTVSGTASYADANAGTGKTVTANSFILSGVKKDNYTLSTVSATTTGSISTRPLAVTANAQSKIYGEADPALTYQITSGTLVGTDTFMGSLTRDAGEDVGPYAIKQGTLALSNNYALTYTGADLTIGQEAITVTANAQSKTYGDADPALTYHITSGALVGTDAFTGSLTRDAGETVGSYAIKQGSLALSSNYMLTYTGANLAIGKKTIAVTAAAKSKVYGTADPALTYTFAPVLISGDTFTGSLTRDAGETVGNYAIKQGTLALSNNYTLNYTGANLTITNATLTVTVQNQDKVYGNANPALTVSYNGFVNDDTQAGLTSKATASTTATTASGVGTYPITASGAAMPGYTIAYIPGVLTVNKAIVNVTAEDKSRNYGLANPPLTVTYSGFVNGDTPASLTNQAIASTNATTASAPGKYAIIASGAASPNYTFTYSSGTFTVIPLTNAVMANLTISSGALSPIFSGSIYQYTASVFHTVDQITLTPTADPTATITINGNASGNGVSSAPVMLSTGDNNITIVVTAQDGVTQQTYSVTVHRALPPAAIVPTNILSPNGDGKNDAWVIKDIELYPNNKVTIYDRAGREVYSKRNYGNDWNGTLHGVPLAQGTYYYIIDLGSGSASIKGFITILKAH